MNKLLVSVLLGVISFSTAYAEETQNDDTVFNQYSEASAQLQK